MKKVPKKVGYEILSLSVATRCPSFSRSTQFESQEIAAKLRSAARRRKVVVVSRLNVLHRSTVGLAVFHVVAFFAQIDIGAPDNP